MTEMAVEADSQVATEGAAARPLGLKRTVGIFAVACSALAQEYGSGINFVMPHSLGHYPGVQSLVPLAMLVAGLVLIPKVALFSRYAKVMPRAGATHVWLTRAIGPYLGFMVAFIYFVSICGGMGFLAYATGTFLASTLHALGLNGAWADGRMGHLAVGLAAIWSLTALHLSGVKRYAYLVYAAAGLVAIAALIVVLTALTADPGVAVGKLAATTGVALAPMPAHPSLGAFISTVALFMFAYGGLSAATSLGGEATNADRSMPRGIVAGWALALVLYTLVAFSLFKAIPWWAALTLAHTHFAYLLTAPALVGLLHPGAVSVFLNVIVMLVVVKTIAPVLLDASRYLYAWAEDGLIPRAFSAVNRRQVPAVALVLSAVVGSLFLLDADFVGWAIGVILRAVSIALTFAALGAGTLMLSWWPAWRASRSEAPMLTSGAAIKWLSAAAIGLGVVLIASVIVKPHAAWYAQPWLQMGVTILLAGLLAGRAATRGEGGTADFHARFRQSPSE